MAGQGYDFGLSFATSSSSGANLNSPFSVQGGGGGNAPGAPAGVNAARLAIVTLVLVGLLAGLYLFFNRK